MCGFGKLEEPLSSVGLKNTGNKYIKTAMLLCPKAKLDGTFHGN